MIYALALLVGLASGLLPLVNTEVFLLGAAATTPLLLIPAALAAATGQTASKTMVFLGARKAFAHPRAAHRTRDGRAAALARRWRDRLESLTPRRGGTTAVVLASATVGVPPLFVTSATVARTAMRPQTFAGLCLAGRAIRFATLLALPSLVL